jgi:WD40 repeat protein
MARRSSQLAIVRDPTREAQSVISPAEAEIRAIENEITSGRDQPLPAFLKHVVDQVCSLTHADGVAVAVCDEWGVVCRASTGNAPGVGSRLRADSGLTRECLETGHVVICEDTEKDYRVDPSIAKSLRLRSAVVVPLRTRNSVLGVLEVLSSRAFAFDRNHVASLQRIAAALGPPLASGRSEEPAANVLFPGSERPEEQKPKVPRYLAAGAVLVLLILLFFVTLHRTQGGAPSASAMPPTSVPVRPTQPTVGQQGTQAEASRGEPVTSPSSSRPDLLAPKALSSSPTPQPRAESTVAQSEKPLTTEKSRVPEVVRPPIPALVILGAPPGAQIFVDDRQVASINPNGQASISTLAAGRHRLYLRLNGYLDYDHSIEVKVDQTSTVTAKLEPFDLPAAAASTNAPIVAVAPVIPAPVISTRAALPDFVLARTLKGHSGWVTTMAFSPDGQRLATGSWDRTVKIWEVSTGEQLSTIEKKNKEIQALAFSRDGRWLATENSSNTVTLLDAATGQEVRALASDKPLGPLGSNWVYSIAFSPDGRWLATGVDDKTVRLWDVTLGTRMRDFTTSRRRITYIAFSPDSRLLASGDDDKTIRIWDVASGEEVRKLSGHRKSIYAVAFSPNGRVLASASGDKTVRLWDVDSGREIRTLTGHGNAVTSLAFSPDGRWLVSGSWDRTVKIWEVGTGREVRTLSGHDQPVYSLAFDPRGFWLASGSEDGTIKLWRLAELTGESRMP